MGHDSGSDRQAQEGLRPPFFRRLPPQGLESKLLYNKQVSVERVFGRLKGYRKLDALRTRGDYRTYLTTERIACS